MNEGTTQMRCHCLPGVHERRTYSIDLKDVVGNCNGVLECEGVKAMRD